MVKGLDIGQSLPVQNVLSPIPSPGHIYKLKSTVLLQQFLFTPEKELVSYFFPSKIEIMDQPIIKSLTLNNIIFSLFYSSENFV